MRGIFSVIVAMLVISLAAYALHLFTHRDGRSATTVSRPQATDAGPRLTAQMNQAAAVRADRVSAESAGAAALVYPGPAASRAMHLNYPVFDVRADGSMMALPLPPGSALETLLSLDPAAHRALAFAPMDADCGFPVDIVVYRADRGTALWEGQLAPHDAKARQLVDLTAVGARAPVLVGLKMAAGAKNNWSCNVLLHWADAPAAS